MISLPVAWAINLVILIFWLVTRPWRSWLSGLVIIIGIILFQGRTFNWHQPQEQPKTATALPIKILSYNVQLFNLNDYWAQRRSSPPARRTINYVVRYDAPIKCFQELFSSTLIPAYNVPQLMKEAGYTYSVVLRPEEAARDISYIGVCIFSKYPIVKFGRQPFEGTNGMLWADIKIGNGTLRVINVHLHSMGIRVGKVLAQDEIDGVKQETRGVLSALRLGFIRRREQVRLVEQCIQDSKHPVIVTGDHNDTPYSVVYERLRRVLSNGFEDAGRGFGFTYNRLPGFIRIDHQFYDSRKLEITNFETINYIRYSDHYPIAGTYVLK